MRLGAIQTNWPNLCPDERCLFRIRPPLPLPGVLCKPIPESGNSRSEQVQTQNRHKFQIWAGTNSKYVQIVFVATVDSLITHTLWWTAQGMGSQGVWTLRRGQTKAKQIKYYLKIQKKRPEDRYTMLLLLRLPECITMRLESLSRKLNIIATLNQ